jgi:light-independent protochlorophyllide reductase subunit B
MGFEGANVIFDNWVHPLMMGLEEHLLGMFREDFEFHDGAAPSHLGKSAQKSAAARTAEDESPAPAASDAAPADAGEITPVWSADAERELGKIPFFVRGKARRNTERFAKDFGLPHITIETLYDAKAHFSR